MRYIQYLLYSAAITQLGDSTIVVKQVDGSTYDAKPEQNNSDSPRFGVRYNFNSDTSQPQFGVSYTSATGSGDSKFGVKIDSGLVIDPSITNSPQINLNLKPVNPFPSVKPPEFTYPFGPREAPPIQIPNIQIPKPQPQRPQGKIDLTSFINSVGDFFRNLFK